MRSEASSEPDGRWSFLGRCVRLLGFLATGCMLTQVTAGGCSESLNSILNTLGEDAVNGVGTVIGNLAQALVLNLFI